MLCISHPQLALELLKIPPGVVIPLLVTVPFGNLSLTLEVFRFPGSWWGAERSWVYFSRGRHSSPVSCTSLTSLHESCLDKPCCVQGYTESPDGLFCLPCPHHEGSGACGVCMVLASG